MDRLLSSEDLAVVNRLLEWVHATRLAGLELGTGSTVHTDIDQHATHWSCTLWVHYERAEPKCFCGGAQPSFTDAIEATLAILPPPSDAARPELGHAPDTEPHNQKPTEPPPSLERHLASSDLTPLDQLIA